MGGAVEAEGGERRGVTEIVLAVEVEVLQVLPVVFLVVMDQFRTK